MLALFLLAAKWLALAGMILTGLFGLWMGRTVEPQTHYLAGMISLFALLAAQTMIVYYFIGMSSTIRHAVRQYDLTGSPETEAQSLKKSVTRPGYLVLLLSMAALVVAGGTLFGRLPSWLHYTLALITLILGIVTAKAEFSAFHRNALLYDRVAEQITAATSEEPGSDGAPG